MTFWENCCIGLPWSFIKMTAKWPWRTAWTSRASHHCSRMERSHAASTGGYWGIIRMVLEGYSQASKRLHGALPRRLAVKDFNHTTKTWLYLDTKSTALCMVYIITLWSVDTAWPPPRHRPTQTSFPPFAI
jgi:hypothetical protein